MSDTPDQPYRYRDAGVDIDAGADLVKRIKPLAKSTARRGGVGALGGFGAIFDLAACGYRDPLLLAATDGVGTKLLVANAVGRHDTVGIDLVAMCVNDLVVQGAEPLFFLDYFATGALNVAAAADVVSGIAEGCRQAGCALIGGETAELPGLYQPGDYDLAGFSVGAVERDGLVTGAEVTPGDVILGIASSGIHSNGYSLVRRVVDGEGLDYAAPAPFDTDTTLGEALLTPTRIYVKSLLAALPHGVRALAHITGGGLLENIPRVLPDGVAAEIDASWELPPVFASLHRDAGVPDDEMLRTFNCGVAMAVIVPENAVDAVSASLAQSGETVFTMGRIVAGDTGIAIAAEGCWQR